jgi:hypothetical protein
MTEHSNQSNSRHTCLNEWREKTNGQNFALAVQSKFYHEAWERNRNSLNGDREASEVAEKDWRVERKKLIDLTADIIANCYVPCQECAVRVPSSLVCMASTDPIESACHC